MFILPQATSVPCETRRGACTRYPEYDAVRHSRLRGMLITFQFSDLKWGTSTRRNDRELTVLRLIFS
jgi:hypothetical protein